MSATTATRTAIDWFEIQCEDLDRATTFYETILAARLNRVSGEFPASIFPYEPKEGTGGMLVKRNIGKPGPGGTLVYLSCEGILNEVLSRVPAAGGLVLLPRTELPGGNGFKACIRDSEGNHVGLHSMV